MNYNSDFDLVGPCAVFNYQYFQMVDLMILHCKRTMKGLNLYSFHYEPISHDKNLKEESTEKAEHNLGYEFVWAIPTKHANKK